MFYRKTLSAIKIWSDLKKQRLCKLSRENVKIYNMTMSSEGICCERTSNMWRYLLFILTSHDASGSRTGEVYTCNPEIYLVLTYDIFMTYCYKYMWHCIKLWYVMWPFLLHHVTIYASSCDHIMWPFILHHVTIFFFRWSCILFHLFVFAVFNSLELTKMSLKSLPCLLFT